MFVGSENVKIVQQVSPVVLVIQHPQSLYNSQGQKHILKNIVKARAMLNKLFLFTRQTTRTVQLQAAPGESRPHSSSRHTPSHQKKLLRSKEKLMTLVKNTLENLHPHIYIKIKLHGLITTGRDEKISPSK